MSKQLEDSVENYLVDKVENKLGGVALKGAVPGRRFLDRIVILPSGVTIYVECKRPKGGVYSAHQDETLDRLAKLGHRTARVKTKAEVDALLSAPAPQQHVRSALERWNIDHSAGRPILMLDGCSVIEAEDAEYLLRLIRQDQAPENHVACPCTLIEQDEDCPVGYPSMLCGVCKGTGNTTPDQVTALACEMIKIASDIGEPEDPFAAWESIELIKSQRDQMRKALADMVPPKLTWKERDADGFLVHHKVAAINAARAALASEGRE